MEAIWDADRLAGSLVNNHTARSVGRGRTWGFGDWWRELGERAEATFNLRRREQDRKSTLDGLHLRSGR